MRFVFVVVFALCQSPCSEQRAHGFQRPEKGLATVSAYFIPGVGVIVHIACEAVSQCDSLPWVLTQAPLGPGVDIDSALLKNRKKTRYPNIQKGKRIRITNSNGNTKLC